MPVYSQLMVARKEAGMKVTVGRLGRVKGIAEAGDTREDNRVNMEKNTLYLPMKMS